jgi:hypothetical protein
MRQGINVRRCGSGYNLRSLSSCSDRLVMCAGAVPVVRYDSFYFVYTAAHWVVVLLAVRV